MSGYVMNPICPICDNQSILVKGKDIYPHRSDLFNNNFYRCNTHLDYYVGCHKNSNKPLGILANKEHRKLKMLCHSQFDPMWQSRQSKYTRRALYNVLAHKMNIPIEECHFGMMTVDRLKIALNTIKEIQIEK